VSTGRRRGCRGFRRRWRARFASVPPGEGKRVRSANACRGRYYRKRLERGASPFPRNVAKQARFLFKKHSFSSAMLTSSSAWRQGGGVRRRSRGRAFSVASGFFFVPPMTTCCNPAGLKTARSRSTSRTVEAAVHGLVPFAENPHQESAPGLFPEPGRRR
jgi:hypothetical protein